MTIKKILKKMDDQTEVSITFGGFIFSFGSKSEVDPALEDLKITKKRHKNGRYIIEACMDGVSINPYAYVLEEEEHILRYSLWLGVRIRYADEGDVYLDETFFRMFSQDPINLIKYIENVQCDAINEFYARGNDDSSISYNYNEIMHEIDKYNRRMLPVTSKFDSNSKLKTTYVLCSKMDQYRDWRD